MITEVVMPQLGADMKEGTIIRWRKAEGDAVERGEVIAEIETDKANIEIEASGAGVFRRALHQDGETVPVGTIIAVIAAPEDDIASYQSGAITPAAPPPSQPAATSGPPPLATTAPGAPAGEDQVESIALSRIRQTVARRTQGAKQNVPHYYLGIDIDMTEALGLRSSVNKALGERGRISVNDIVVMATSRALVQHPRLNAYWADDHIERHSRVNIGVAVALADGLVAPAIIDAANKGLEQISIEARDVARRARSGALTPDEYTAATFNVSNVGGFGVDTILAIISQPQVGVLGVGAVKEKPVVRNGQIVVRQIMNVTLSADHRATDGADGARFLETLRKLLEAPEKLL